MSKRKYTHIKMLYPGMGQSIEAARGALLCSHPAWKRVFFYAGVSRALMKACVKREMASPRRECGLKSFHFYPLRNWYASGIRSSPQLV